MRPPVWIDPEVDGAGQVTGPMWIGDALVALNDRYAKTPGTPLRRARLEGEVRAMLVGDDPRVEVATELSHGGFLTIQFRLKEQP